MGAVAHRSRAAAAARLGGVLMLALGAANVAFGVASLAGDAVQLSPATAGSLLLLGVLVVALGVLVRRGSRTAITASLSIFAFLLVLQLPAALEDGLADPGVASRMAILLVLVVVLSAGLRGGTRPTR